MNTLDTIASIREIIPIYDLKVQVKIQGRRVGDAKAILSGAKLVRTTSGDYEFTVPKVESYEATELSYSR